MHLKICTDICLWTFFLPRGSHVSGVSTLSENCLLLGTDYETNIHAHFHQNKGYSLSHLHKSKIERNGRFGGHNVPGSLKCISVWSKYDFEKKDNRFLEYMNLKLDGKI